MTGILPPELKSIEQLFTSDIRYSVPKYQRSFAWGTDEIEELWDDLSSTIHRSGDYFLGTIVLQKKNEGPQEIIDGQQRLACISMIFSAIRNVFLATHDDRAEQLFLAFLGAKNFSRDAPERPKLILNHVNNEIYVEYVINSQNLEIIDKTLKGKSLNESNRLLLQAYRYFLFKITTEVANRGTNSEEFIVPLIDVLRNSVKLIAIPVTSEEDANLFFESLNARGKELAVSDLVKNRLYLETGDQVSRAQQLWDAMESELARKPITEYIRHYWIAKKVDTKGMLVREKQLYKFVTQDVHRNRVAALSLLTDLAKTASDYLKISDYSLWPDNDAYGTTFEETLRDLSLFRVTQCNPILLNTIQKFHKAKDIALIFQIVANFSFRYFIIGNQSPGSLERVSNGIAFGIRNGEYINPRDVADAFLSINSDLTFKADFSLAMMPKSRAKIARYILSKLTNFMSKQTSRVGSEKIVNPDSKQVNLEHILPVNFSEAWKTTFLEGIEPSDYVYRLGNLTLLTNKVNNSIANKSFSDKKRLALINSTLAINQYFKNISDWNDIAIEERQKEMTKVALEIWKL